MDSRNSSGDLVSKAVAGSEEAFTRLVAELDFRLRIFLDWRIPADMRGYLGVEDVAQEAYLEVSTRIHTFVPQGANGFEAWVKTIALNKLRQAIEKHRALKRGGGWVRVTQRLSRAGSATRDCLNSLVAPGKTPSDAASRREELRVLERAMKRLPSHYRQAVRLVYFERLTQEAAAERMQRTPSSINNICVKAKQFLKRNLVGDAFRYHGEPDSPPSNGYIVVHLRNTCA